MYTDRNLWETDDSPRARVSLLEAIGCMGLHDLIYKCTGKMFLLACCNAMPNGTRSCMASRVKVELIENQLFSVCLRNFLEI